MVVRAVLYRGFAERFHAGKRIRPATAAQLADAEAALNIVWPQAYLQFAMTCGALYTPSLLDLIAKNKVRLGDVQQFLTPKQSFTETRRWYLEDGCAAFASDCSGSFFTFRQLPSSVPRPDDAVVWLFDHDAGEYVVQTASFDEWIGRFLKL